MSIQPMQGTFIRDSGPLSTQGTTRTTGKLLATQGYVVGIEISGSGSRQSVTLADLEGNILYRVRRPLEYVPDTATVLKLIDEMIEETLTAERLRGGRVLRVGVAVGGLVDASRGVVRTLHHAHGWHDFPLQDYLEKRLDRPCIIDNNANAAALAEVYFGAAANNLAGQRTSERVVFYVGLGRGIGGGMVVDGKIYHGVSSTAGEIGHMLVKENGPKCSCGSSGHLEAIASAQAIVRAMIGLSVEHPETEAAIRRVTGGRAERITAEQVFRLAAEGDVVAKGVTQEVCTCLGIALANIIHIINPGMIILGGQVAQAGDLLIEPLKEHLYDLCLEAAIEGLTASGNDATQQGRLLRVVQGALGSDANSVGAITLALQDI